MIRRIFLLTALAAVPALALEPRNLTAKELARELKRPESLFAPEKK